MLRIALVSAVMAMAATAALHGDRGQFRATANSTAIAPLRVGAKRFFLQTVKSNWYRAMEFCNYQNMRLASISSQEENDRVALYIKNSGFGAECFWTAGTDLAQQGKYVWMSTGEPMVYTNWLAGEPNHGTAGNGSEVEHCVQLWPQDYGFTWNDSFCSYLFNFICEV